MVKNMLNKKLFRDMWIAKWQFLSIIILSSLCVMVFCGLDAAWRDIEVSMEQFFKEQKLSDLWVKLPEADYTSASKISNVNGVKEIQSRVVEDGIAKDLKSEPTVRVHGYDGNFKINIPKIVEGESLGNNDIRGCLLEKQFAETQGLSVDDNIKVTIKDEEYSFIIRGLVISPEHVWSADDIVPDPSSYGYILVQSRALTSMNLNEVLVMVDEDSSVEVVKENIESIFPYALVLDHNSHTSTNNIMSEVKQFQSFSIIIPVLFVLVAALVILTTISRMVDGQRTQIGTLKSLGYSNKKLFLHYLGYGLFPSLIGSVFGLIIGRGFLPEFLWNTMGENYTLPKQISSTISSLAVLVSILIVILSVVISYLTCRKQLKESAAELMRPKPPKAGDRILLERFTKLWNKLSFNTKLVFRNLFRAKIRTIMAFFGVIACTMLIIVSLGMNDTFKDMVSSYYEDTYTNDLKVILKDDAGILESYQKRLQADKVEGTMNKNINIHSNSNSKTVLLSVVSDDQSLINFGDSIENMMIPKDGIVITEKLASLMGVKLNDELTITLPGDKEPIHTKVSKLAPISMGQGIFASKTAWDSFGKDQFIPTDLLIKNPSNECIETLDRMDTVENYAFTTEQSQKTASAMQALTGVAILLFIFALMLAAIVLYNMGILNFAERTREFATLKVLGYRKKEIRSLIIRENLLISISGVILGIIPGILFTGMAMKMAEPDDMVMNPVIEPVSIIIACLVTISFSLIIQLILSRKVNSINMVEALKSVE